MADNYECQPCTHGGYKEVVAEKSAPIKPCGEKEELERPTQRECSGAETNQQQYRPVPPGNPPCYLPQPTETSGKQVAKDENSKMGSLGPWATGRVDWGPLAGLTGTRPVVDKYSITRYSEGEWRQRNEENFNSNYAAQQQNNLIICNAQQCMEKSRADADKEQADNGKRLSQRASDIHRWKCELERAIEAATEELRLLQTEYNRLKQAMAILTIPQSIAAELLDLRTGRLEPDLVRDEPEEELIKELALTAEIRDIFTRTLNDLTLMIVEMKTAKQRLEFDWSDKKVAHEIEAVNCALNNRSSIILFSPGVTRFPEEQSTQQHWEHFTSETLTQSETARQRSVALRGTLDAILINASRDLRTQADTVDSALARRIACTEELKTKLEIELKKVLKQLVDSENLILELQHRIRNLDYTMKVVQTRLHNQFERPRVENCREESQYGLMNEVKHTSERVAALTSQLTQAEAAKEKLLGVRSNLERELMIKMKNLQIDKTRGQLIRSHYPSASALSGH